MSELGSIRNPLDYPDLESKNITPGVAPTADQRIDGALFDANYKGVLELTHVWRLVDGDCTSDTADPDYLIFTTPDNTINAEHNVVVYYESTHRWRAEVLSNDRIKIEDATLAKGAASPIGDANGGAGYDTLTVGSLLVATDGGGDVVLQATKDSVAGDGSPEDLTGDDIARKHVAAVGDAAPDSIEDALAAVEDNFDVEHESDGTHSDSVLTAANFSPSTGFASDGRQNLIDFGSFERWLHGYTNVPWSSVDTSGNVIGYALHGGATIARETTTKKYGTSSAQITAGSANQGLRYNIDNYADLQGQTITVWGYVYQSSAGDVEMRVEDGVDTTTGTAVTLSAGWQLVYCTHTVNAAASELSIYNVSSGAGATWFLDGLAAAIGTLVKTFEESILDRVSDDNNLPLNQLLNSNFESWAAENGSDLPDFWEKQGLGALAVDEDTGVSGKGIRIGAGSATGALTGITQKIGKLLSSSGAINEEPVCFSVWARLGGVSDAENTWRVALYDGANELTCDFEASDLSSSGWIQLCAIAEDGLSTPGSAEVRIYSVDGETSGKLIYFSNPTLTVGRRPPVGTNFGPLPSAWRIEKYTLRHDGELAGDGYVGGWEPVTALFYPLRMDVYCGRGPGAMSGTGEYILHAGGFGSGESAKNLQATVDAAGTPDADGAGSSNTNSLANALADDIDEGAYLRIYQDLTATNDNPENITAIVTGVVPAT